MGAMVCAHLQRNRRLGAIVHVLPAQSHAHGGFLSHGDHQTYRLHWRYPVYHWIDSVVSCDRGDVHPTSLMRSSLVSLQSGGYTHPWTSGYVLGTMLSGLALIAAWVVYEWKFARHPMVPGELFKGQRIVGLAYVVAFAAGMNFFSILNFFPVTFTSVYDPDPVRIGVRGLGPAFTTALGAIGFNAALSFFPNHTREVLLLAVLIMTGFAGSLAVMTPDNGKLVVALGSMASFGVGGVLVPAATVAMLVCPDALITTAAAMSLSIRTVGGSIGYSIYYNVFATKLEKNLPAYVAEYAIRAGLPLTSATQFVTTFLTDPEALATTDIPGMTPAVIAGATKGTQWAYSQSLKYVWVSRFCT